MCGWMLRPIFSSNSSNWNFLIHNYLIILSFFENS